MNRNRMIKILSIVLSAIITAGCLLIVPKIDSICDDVSALTDQEGSTAKFSDVTDKSKYYYNPVSWASSHKVTYGYDDGTFRPENTVTRAQMVTFLWRMCGSPKPKTTKSPFSDIKKSDYWYKPALWGNENKIVFGYKDGTFKPQTACTRAQAVTFMYRMSDGKSHVSSADYTFSDLKNKKNEYYYNAAYWGMEAGIVVGSATNKASVKIFNPQGKITRGQMVTFLYKLAKYSTKTDGTGALKQNVMRQDGTIPTGNNKDNTPTPTQKPTSTPSPTPGKTDPIVGDKTSFKDLKIKGIGKVEDIYVGLQYAKLSPTLPTLGDDEEVDPNHQVLLAFFEFYNGSKNPVYVSPSDISCYVDGTQVSDVDNFYKVYADGVAQCSSTSLDDHCQLLTVQDFEIPKQWKEIKLFYKSKCIWTLSPANTSTNAYMKTTLFNISDNKKVTGTGTVLYADDYKVQYKGARIYERETYSGVEHYIVFKFRITNNMDTTLSTSLMGYRMRFYQDNYYIDDADYIISDQIDGYINIHDIDSIETGMSANVYAAVEISEPTGKFFMAYDDGYISSNYLGSVCTVIK